MRFVHTDVEDANILHAYSRCRLGSLKIDFFFGQIYCNLDTVNDLFSAQCAKESLFFCQFFGEKIPL